MDCENAIHSVNIGDLPKVSDVKGLITNCPQLCRAVWGSGDFQLAGTGVLLAIGIQTLLFAVYGLLQAILSFIVRGTATFSTRLLVARLQAIFDTSYRCGIFLAFGILFTIVSTHYNGIKAYESQITADMMSLETGLLCIGLIVYAVQIEPSANLERKIWKLASAWVSGQVFILLSLHTSNLDGWIHKSDIAGVCARETDLYPEPDTDDDPTMQEYLLIVAGTSCALVSVGYLGWKLLPSYAWQYVTKVTSTRIFFVLLMLPWTVTSMIGIGEHSAHLIHVFKKLAAEGDETNLLSQWDFAQILAILLWVPVLWHALLAIFLTLLSSGKTGTIGIVRELLIDLVTFACKCMNSLMRASCANS